VPVRSRGVIRVPPLQVNGICAGEHDGGYTPFSFDITALISNSTAEIVVRAEDDPADLTKPRGKQDWQLDPHSIWYPRSSMANTACGTSRTRELSPGSNSRETLPHEPEGGATGWWRDRHTRSAHPPGGRR